MAAARALALGEAEAIENRLGHPEGRTFLDKVAAARDFSVGLALSPGNAMHKVPLAASGDGVVVRKGTKHRFLKALEKGPGLSLRSR